jgi:hypothetical protein
MQFDGVAKPASVKAPGYLMTVANLPSATDATKNYSSNLLISNVKDNQYISSKIVLKGKQMDSTKPLTFNAVKYYNINYSYARPGNMVLANESDTYATWGSNYNTEAPSVLKAQMVPGMPQRI